MNDTTMYPGGLSPARVVDNPGTVGFGPESMAADGEVEGVRQETAPAEPAREDLSTVTTAAAVVTVDDDDYADDAGAGLENVSMDEQVTPFIDVLQGLSPQLNPAEAKFIQGATMGMLWNNATGRVYDGGVGIEVMACWREWLFTEWVPRNDVEYPDGRVIKGGGGEGGFRGPHRPESPEVRRAIDAAIERYGDRARFRPIPFVNAETKEETVLLENRNVGILYGAPTLTPENARRAMLVFRSTKLRVYSPWITQLNDLTYWSAKAGRMVTPPMWAHLWRLVTVSQTNKRGTFFNFKLGLARPGESKNSRLSLRDPLYAMGRDFYEMWKAGQVKVNHAASMGGDVADGTGRRMVDEDVPF